MFRLWHPVHITVKDAEDVAMKCGNHFQEFQEPQWPKLTHIVYWNITSPNQQQQHTFISLYKFAC